MTTDDGRLVALIDETADQTYYRIGALVIRAGAVRKLAAELDGVMAKAQDDHGIPATTELHGHEMFHGGKGWECLKRGPRARIAIYGQALDVVGRFAETVIIRGVHRPGFQLRYASRPDWNEHEAALMFVMERLDLYARNQRQPMFIFADDCRFAASVRGSLERFKLSGTWGYRGRVLEQIQSIEFVDSAAYRQIQAIDLITYIKHRRASGRDQDPRAKAANEKLWEKISHRVHVDYDWYP